MVETDDLVRSFEGVLTSELDLYRQLEALSVRQLEALEAVEPDIELVARTMQAKQDLIFQISELESQNAPLKKRYESTRETIPDARKTGLVALRSELDALLATLLDMEKRGEERMKRHGEVLERQLRALQNARRARTAYQAYANQSRPPHFIDRRK